MNPCIEKLKTYLDEQPINAVYNDAESLLELLCYIYITESPIDNATIHYQYQQINSIMERFTLEENQIFNLIVDMCDAYIRQAFMDGIRVGYHLLMELSTYL